MIDEKKLIEDIDNRVQGLTNIQINKIADIINEQPKVDDWIPVSERLPNDKQEVQITDSQGRVRQIIFNKWLFANPQYSHGIKMIAWMPLPKAYKEEVTE